MASIKTDAKLKPRAMLNTTIKTEALESFKAYCKEIGYPMNMVLESFMEQFVNGEFILKIAKANKLSVEFTGENEE